MDSKKIESLLQVDLIKELHLETLPAEDRQGMLDQMSELIGKAIWLRILDNLNNDQVDKLNALLDNVGDLSEVTEFLKANIPSVEEIIREEVAKYKEMMLPAHLG